MFIAICTIDGSRGCHRHVPPPPPPPQQDQFLSFLHMFLPKSVRIGGWRPQRVGAPQQEILDPPLCTYRYVIVWLDYYGTCTCGYCFCGTRPIKHVHDVISISILCHAATLLCYIHTVVVFRMQSFNSRCGDDELFPSQICKPYEELTCISWTINCRTICRILFKGCSIKYSFRNSASA